MANMTFKTNLLPNSTTQEYSLGSETQKWKINGVDDPKLTDTITTITSSGNGNVATVFSATNGAITVTKGAYAPTTAGTANQILVSAGGTAAPTWKATANGAAYATSSNGALTFGTLPVAQGGTGQTSVANIQAGKDADGNTISSTYLKLSGGTMTGALTVAQLNGTSNTTYGDTLPSSGTAGQIFLQTTDDYYELPAGGTTGQVLVKNTDDDRDVKWVDIEIPDDVSDQLSNYVKKTGDTMTGSIIQKMTDITRGTTPSANTYRTYEFTDTNNTRLAQLEFGSLTTGYNRLHLYVLGNVTDTSTNSYGGLIIQKASGNTSNGTCTLNANAGTITGAVWNDYAEYRESKITEPGRCIKETGTGELILTNNRLEKGCEIVSDTFGFAIGQSQKYNTPVACAGRVLAYPYENINIFKQNIGQAVCSGPNGTVSIMTDQEARDYPQCIIGTVSEIPTYETWYAGGEGSNSTPIKVNGRIWIRIR